MRISDWSSDVCSSDLSRDARAVSVAELAKHLSKLVRIFHLAERRQIERGARLLLELPDAGTVHIEHQPDAVLAQRIGQFADEIAFGGPARMLFLPALDRRRAGRRARSEERTSALQSLMRTSYAVV